jgi:hypothetical protein
MNATDFTSEPIGYSPLANERTITLDDFNERVARIVKRAQYLALITVEEAIRHEVKRIVEESQQGCTPLHIDEIQLDQDEISTAIRAAAATLGVPVPKGAQQ